MQTSRPAHGGSETAEEQREDTGNYPPRIRRKGNKEIRRQKERSILSEQRTLRGLEHRKSQPTRLKQRDVLGRLCPSKRRVCTIVRL